MQWVHRRWAIGTRTASSANAFIAVDSMEPEEWEEMPLVAAAPPEDWTGPLADVEP